MKADYAVYCDGLVLGIGRTVAQAYRDAKMHGADDEEDSGLQYCHITLAAANHVLAGGDCRALHLHLDDNPELDCFTLKSS